MLQEGGEVGDLFFLGPKVDVDEGGRWFGAKPFQFFGGGGELALKFADDFCGLFALTLRKGSVGSGFGHGVADGGSDGHEFLATVGGPTLVRGELVGKALSDVARGVDDGGADLAWGAEDGALSARIAELAAVAVEGFRERFACSLEPVLVLVDFFVNVSVSGDGKLFQVFVLQILLGFVFGNALFVGRHCGGFVFFRFNFLCLEFLYLAHCVRLLGRFSIFKSLKMGLCRLNQ